MAARDFPMIHTRRASDDAHDGAAMPCGDESLQDLRPHCPNAYEYCVQWDALTLGAWGTFADALEDLRAGLSIQSMTR